MEKEKLTPLVLTLGLIIYGCTASAGQNDKIDSDRTFTVHLYSPIIGDEDRGSIYGSGYSGPYLAPGALFNALLNNKEFQQLDFSSLHLSAGGGMPVQQVVAERWVKLTGQYLLEGYGLTESAPLVSVNPYDIDYHSGSIGLPVPSTEAKLVDDDDNEVPPGQPGELCVKGPQVMLGYWQRPDATDEIIKNGWLHTGDIAVMDEEGFLRIVDRKKDMILVSGFNVYPNEIEDVVMQHPGVQEVAAVGVPSGSSGEAVKIFVVKKDPSLTEESLVTFCRRQLTGYKVPKLVEFRDELPKSNVGKILRRELRDEARGKVDNKA